MPKLSAEVEEEVEEEAQVVVHLQVTRGAI
jgi:hypothetical protein